MVVFHDRRGDCYRQAGRYAMKTPNSFVVHGSVEVPGKDPFLHAWVVHPQGGKLTVHDPVVGRDIPHETASKYYRPTTSYTSEEATKRSVKSGHWGPWD